MNEVRESNTPHHVATLPKAYTRFDCDEFHRNPHPTYKLLRLLHPITYWAEHKAWLLTRHADVTAIREDRRFGTNRHADAPEQAWKFLRSEDIEALGTDSQRTRGAFGPYSLRTQHALLRDITARISAQKLLSLRRVHQFDLVVDFAYGVSIRVMAGLLGIPDRYLATFIQFAHAHSDLLNRQLNHAPDELYNRTMQLQMGLDLIRETVRMHRKLADGPLLISHLLREQREKRLTDAELVSSMVILAVEGIDHSRQLIASTVYQLLCHTDAYAQVQANPGLWPNAVRETLRYDYFVKLGAPYYALEDCHLHSTPIARGDRVYPIIAAAQRDPDVFSQPDTFDITRALDAVIDSGLNSFRGIDLNLPLLAEIATRTLFESLPALTMLQPPTYDTQHKTLRAMTSLKLKSSNALQ